MNSVSLPKNECSPLKTRFDPQIHSDLPFTPLQIRAELALEAVENPTFSGLPAQILNGSFLDGRTEFRIITGGGGIRISQSCSFDLSFKRRQKGS